MRVWDCSGGALNEEDIHGKELISLKDTVTEAENDLLDGGRKEIRELSREEISTMIELFEDVRRPRMNLGTSLFQEISQESSSKKELIQRQFDVFSLLPFAFFFKFACLFRLEEALNLTLPYWDFEMDRRLANPIDSLLLHSELFKSNRSQDGADIERILSEEEDDSAEHVLRILDEGKADTHKEALRILRRSNFTQFLYILLDVAKFSVYSTGEDCDRCPPSNQWLFCDLQQMHCASKVIINGNCSNFKDNAMVCHKSDCINGKCSPPLTTFTTPTTIPTLITIATDFPTPVVSTQQTTSSTSDISNTVIDTSGTYEEATRLESTITTTAELQAHGSAHPIQSDSAEPYMIRPLQVTSADSSLKFMSAQLTPTSTFSLPATSQPKTVQLSMPEITTTESVPLERPNKLDPLQLDVMHTLYSTQLTPSPYRSTLIPADEKTTIEYTAKNTTPSSTFVTPTTLLETSSGTTLATSQQLSSEITAATTTSAMHFPTFSIALVLDEENKSQNVSFSSLQNKSHGGDVIIPTVYKLLESEPSSTLYTDSATISGTTVSSPIPTVLAKLTTEPRPLHDFHSASYDEEVRRTAPPTTSMKPTEVLQSRTIKAQPTLAVQQLKVKDIKAEDDIKRPNNASNYRNESATLKVQTKITELRTNTTERTLVTYSPLSRLYATTTMQSLLPTRRGARKRTKKPGRRKNKTRPQGGHQMTRKQQSVVSATDTKPSTSTPSMKPTKPISGPMSRTRHPSQGSTTADVDSISWHSKPPFARDTIPTHHNDGRSPEESSSTPIVYFSITVIEGEPRRKAFLNRRLEQCEITVTGMNMPSGYTQTTHGRLVPGTTIGLVHTLDPELHAPLVEFRITVTDRMGRECEQRCLNDKGFYERCDRNSVRLTSHEFIAFSDPIETHESEEDVLKNQWSGRGYYRKRKKDYLLFSCAKS
ncbi:unnamed protein product [Toxocara canis]|uniref:MANSC domain-containing protein n=1 Tax=Toxocara canis TaxID=6265 RepID=A0A183V3U6_TOXCA|nr:unnamed protein product [Toxocara canis]